MQEQLFNQAHRHSGSHTLVHRENPQESLNRCIRLKAPANTHSQKSLDKQPGENNSKSSGYHCSLPLVHLFHKLIIHIALTQYPVAFLFPHLLLLPIFPFPQALLVHTYLSISPHYSPPRSHYRLPLFFLNYIA